MKSQTHADLKTLKENIKKDSEIKELICSYVVELDLTDQFVFCQTLPLSFNL